MGLVSADCMREQTDESVRGGQADVQASVLLVVGIPCALCGNDVRAWNSLECGEVPEETVIAEFRLLG